MQPIDFPEANRTFTRPEGMTDEECGPLRVCDTGEALQSVWQPDEADRAALAAGAPVVLSIFGRGHPVVSLGVVQLAAGGAVPDGPGYVVGSNPCVDTLPAPARPRDPVSGR
jgi:hypothetical protein